MTEQYEEKKLNVWHCEDCKEGSLVETTKYGGLTIHCCFYCGSSRKTYLTSHFLLADEQ